MASSITDDGAGTYSITATAVSTSVDYTFYILISIDGGSTKFKSALSTLRIECQASNFNTMTIASET